MTMCDVRADGCMRGWLVEYVQSRVKTLFISEIQCATNNEFLRKLACGHANFLCAKHFGERDSS